MNAPKKLEPRTHWVAVLLIFTTSFIYYFPYDHLQPLMGPIIEEYHLNLTGFNLAYALSDVPTLFILLLAPRLVRSIGSGTLLVISVVSMSLGQLIIAFSALPKSFVLLLIGRLLLGLLREPFALLIQVLLRKYFSPSHFRYMIALQVITITNAKIINVYVIPSFLLYTESLTNTLFICWVIAQLSTIAAIVYLLRKNQNAEEEDDSELFEDRHGEKRPSDRVSFILLVVVVHILQGGCFKAFSNVAVEFLQKHYKLSVLQAGELWSLHYIAFAVICPLLFWVTAKYSRAVLNLFAASSGILALGLFINTFGSVTYWNALISVILYAGFLGARIITVYPLLSEIELPNLIISNLQFAIAAEAFGFVTVPLFNSLISDVYYDPNQIFPEYLNKLFVLSLITFVLGLVCSFRYYQKHKAHPAVHVE